MDITKFEFETVKQLRKSLLTTSTIGVIISYMIEYSKGDIRFLGFTFPEESSFIVSRLIGFLILYFLISFLIRFYVEETPKVYKKRFDAELDELFSHNPAESQHFEEHIEEQLKKRMEKRYKAAKLWTKFLDVLLPVVFGVFSILVCFFGAI